MRSEIGADTVLVVRPSRRRPVHLHPYERDATSTIIFVTVCTKNRKAILANDSAHECVLASWKAAKAWLVGRYVLMPDHMHFFCSPMDATTSLPRWIQYWKSLASRRWPDVGDQPIWQTDFWDSQLRHNESYEAKWKYVRNNPVRHGLTASSDAWPYQGELHILSLD